jgi:ABC-2 type transport system permease protein
MSRASTLVSKELLDVRRNPGVLLPVVIATGVLLIVSLFVLVVAPALRGQPLGDDADLSNVVRAAVVGHPELKESGRIQLFLFQQFLMFFLLTPTTGAMSLAAHAVIGEKQARTLEPLLATSITTTELLVAKVLGALIPTLVVSVAGLAVYFGLLSTAAEPGVMAAMFDARTFMLLAVVGPLIALVSLQGAIVISSRVNDARTAQQFGVFIVLPLMAVVIAQFSGALWLSAAMLAIIALALFGVWILMVLLSVRIFDRETILTRWR